MNKGKEENKDKKSKKAQKEKELLDFITELKKKASTISETEVINKLLDKIPKDTESETLKVKEISNQSNNLTFASAISQMFSMMLLCRLVKKN